MATTNIRAVLDYNIEAVWKVVTSFDNYAWRNDLSKIEAIDAGKICEIYQRRMYYYIYNYIIFSIPSKQNSNVFSFPQLTVGMTRIPFDAK